MDSQDQLVRVSSPSNSSSSPNDSDSSESSSDSSDDSNASDMSNGGETRRMDENGSSNRAPGFIVYRKEGDELEPDPYIDITIGNYTVIAKNEASKLYRCVNNINEEVHLCSIVTAEKNFNFMATYERLRNHPGINQIAEIVTSQEKSLIVYTKTYDDLHSYVLNKGKLDEFEAANLFHQIVAIIADLHDLGIISRDLKIRKFVFKDESLKTLVLETWEDSILLNDPENDALTEKYGCPTYASPELLDPNKMSYSGKKADCWALGIILYALLTNRYPFYHVNINLMLKKIKSAYFNMPENLSSQVKGLIKSLLASEPHLRPSAIDILGHDWFRQNQCGGGSRLRRLANQIRHLPITPNLDPSLQNCLNHLSTFSPSTSSSSTSYLSFGNLGNSPRTQESLHLNHHSQCNLRCRNNLEQEAILLPPSTSGRAHRKPYQPPKNDESQRSDTVPDPTFSPDQIVPPFSSRISPPNASPNPYSTSPPSLSNPLNDPST